MAASGRHPMRGPWTMLLRSLFVAGMAFGTPSSQSRAQERTADPRAAARVESPERADAAFELLLHSPANPFVEQKALDPLIESDGGGVCPRAVCINALQVLRVMAG